MTGTTTEPRLEEVLHTAFVRRTAAALGLVDQAGAVAEACEAMADRFLRGGTLLVLGCGTGAADAAHVAVEFVHPVIVGKRALPAVALTGDVATLSGLVMRDVDDALAARVRLLGREQDVLLALSGNGREPTVRKALQEGRARGMLTVALAGADGGALAEDGAVDHLLTVPSEDPQVVKEVQVTAYHVLWELVHVFLENAGSEVRP